MFQYSLGKRSTSLDAHLFSWPLSVAKSPLAIKLWSHWKGGCCRDPQIKNEARLTSSPKKWSEVKVAQLCLTVCDPLDYTVHGILQARILEWVPFPSPGDLPNPGIKPRSPTLQKDSLPAEPQGKPRSTGVGSLSFLQRIFLTQEWNWCLLHCRQTLYQVSYQGSPMRNRWHLF